MSKEEAAKKLVPIIRDYLRDHPQLNRLIDGVEHGDRMIEWAIVDTWDDINATPPPISFQLEEIPVSILKMGVVKTLLESLMFLDTRNSLAYQDGDVSVSIEKTPALMQLHQLMERRYEEKKIRWKIAENIKRCGASIYSEYWHLSGYLGK